jgi:hypothetical protein
LCMFVCFVTLVSFRLAPKHTNNNNNNSSFFLVFFSLFPSQCPWLTAIVMFVCTLHHLPTPCTKNHSYSSCFLGFYITREGFVITTTLLIPHTSYLATDLSSEYRKEMMQQYSVVLRQKPSPSEKLSLALAPIIQNIVQE